MGLTGEGRPAAQGACVGEQQQLQPLHWSRGCLHGRRCDVPWHQGQVGRGRVDLAPIIHRHYFLWQLIMYVPACGHGVHTRVHCRLFFLQRDSVVGLWPCCCCCCSCCRRHPIAYIATSWFVWQVATAWFNLVTIVPR